MMTTKSLMILTLFTATLAYGANDTNKDDPLGNNTSAKVYTVIWDDGMTQINIATAGIVAEKPECYSLRCSREEKERGERGEALQRVFGTRSIDISTLEHLDPKIMDFLNAMADVIEHLKQIVDDLRRILESVNPRVYPYPPGTYIPHAMD